jgi:hypothetical protein
VIVCVGVFVDVNVEVFVGDELLDEVGVSEFVELEVSVYLILLAELLGVGINVGLKLLHVVVESLTCKEVVKLFVDVIVTDLELFELRDDFSL